MRQRMSTKAQALNRTRRRMVATATASIMRESRISTTTEAHHLKVSRKCGMHDAMQMLSTVVSSETTLASPPAGGHLLLWLSRRIGETEKQLPRDTVGRRAGSLRVIGHGRRWQERICTAILKEIQQRTPQKVILIVN
jgi:hypothetical protein